MLSSFFRHLHNLWQTLNPRRSLRARLALTFGLLVLMLTVGLVVSLELTAVNQTITLNTLTARLERQIWVSGLFLTVTFVIVAWIIAGRIARPLRIVAEAARELHEKEQEHVIPTFPGQDEVASLSRSLNILVANLRTQQKALREANDLLEQRVTERTRQLEILYDVLEIGNKKEALLTLLDRALRRILQESHAGVGCIHLLDQDSQQMKMVTHYQLLQPVVAAYACIPINLPIVQDTLQQESFWLINDVRAASYDPELARLINHQQALCLPIRRGERYLGIMTVFATESHFFERDEMDLFSSLADQLGIMIENDRLRQQAEQLSIVDERNRLARELHDSVTQALYSATLFAEAGQKQAQAGNMDKALIYLDDVLGTSRQALKEMRLLVHKLRPSTLEKEGLGDKKIIVWDHNRDLINHRANTILEDPEAAKYVWGVGFHWYETWTGSDPMFTNLDNVKESFPDKNLIFTEGCNESFDPSRYQYFPNAERYGRSMINDFNQGTVAWTDWNILLDETGGPNHVLNLCFAPVHADLPTGTLVYTPSYYYIGHFSKFIRPGAKRVSTVCSRSHLLSTSFLNEDGSMATVVMNHTDNAINYKLYIGTKAIEQTIFPHAMQTLVY